MTKADAKDFLTSEGLDKQIEEKTNLSMQIQVAYNQIQGQLVLLKEMKDTLAAKNKPVEDTK